MFKNLGNILIKITLCREDIRDEQEDAQDERSP